MRGAVLNCRIVELLTLLMVIIPTSARSHANFLHVPSLADTRIRDILDELDPDDTDNCLSLGELDIVFRTGNDGPPNVGVVLTDPRGRRIGFDPLIKHAWQALPVAQGDISCDDPGNTNTLPGNCPGMRADQRDLSARSNRPEDNILQRECSRPE
jgi:hypothetical protein